MQRSTAVIPKTTLLMASPGRAELPQRRWARCDGAISRPGPIDCLRNVQWRWPEFAASRRFSQPSIVILTERGEPQGEAEEPIR